MEDFPDTPQLDLVYASISASTRLCNPKGHSTCIAALYSSGVQPDAVKVLEPEARIYTFHVHSNSLK